MAHDRTGICTSVACYSTTAWGILAACRLCMANIQRLFCKHDYSGPFQPLRSTYLAIIPPRLLIGLDDITTLDSSLWAGYTCPSRVRCLCFGLPIRSPRFCQWKFSKTLLCCAANKIGIPIKYVSTRLRKLKSVPDGEMSLEQSWHRHWPVRPREGLFVLFARYGNACVREIRFRHVAGSKKRANGALNIYGTRLSDSLES